MPSSDAGTLTLETATFRAGDVVLLRWREPMSLAAMDRMNAQLKDLSDETGVKFVLLGSDIDVIVPEPDPSVHRSFRGEQADAGP